MFTAAAVMCLAINAYHEARGEGVEGVHAVTHVVINRMESSRWPDDACAVIEQPSAFSWTHQNPKEPDPEVLAWVYESVVDAVMLPDSTGGATHYHADSVRPYWAKLYPQTAVVQNHIFYFAPRGL